MQSFQENQCLTPKCLSSKHLHAHRPRPNVRTAQCIHARISTTPRSTCPRLDRPLRAAERRHRAVRDVYVVFGWALEMRRDRLTGGGQCCGGQRGRCGTAWAVEAVWNSGDGVAPISRARPCVDNLRGRVAGGKGVSAVGQDVGKMVQCEGSIDHTSLLW